MSNYLMKYKGIYRLKAPYDLKTHQFPRRIDGTLEDNDVYIDCQKDIKIFNYGHGILRAYIPSLIKGNNIIKVINKEIDSDVIYDIEKTDEEVLFKFKARDLNILEKYLKPKINGANISPFSTRNLPKNKGYKIPDEDLVMYKDIIKNIPPKLTLGIGRTTDLFIKSLANKKTPYENIKADMVRSGLKQKEYIHSINKWDAYLNYLRRALENK